MDLTKSSSIWTILQLSSLDVILLGEPSNVKALCLRNVEGVVTETLSDFVLFLESRIQLVTRRVVDLDVAEAEV